VAVFVIRNAIFYKGLWLAPGSQGRALHDERRFDELDKLISRCLREEKQREA
jgi:hypothetical protein